MPTWNSAPRPVLSRAEAVAEFVRETAYTWANRLLALRCMEARELIDEVILQKSIYGGRSLEHHRLAQRQPELCAGEDDGLFAVLDKVFAEQARHLPMLFDPEAPGVALKPSAAAIKRCMALLTEKARQVGTFQDQFLGYEATAGFNLLNVLSRKYDVVAANPPYMNSSNLSRKMVIWLQANYLAAYRDLYAVFIMRAWELLDTKGSLAFVTMQSFMSIASFEAFRLWMLSSARITHLYRLGINAFPEMGDHVNAVLTVAQKHDSFGVIICCNLQKYADKAKALQDRTLDSKVGQERLSQIPGVPFVLTRIHASLTSLRSGR